MATIDGGAGDDDLVATRDSDLMHGFAGNDTITTGGGVDTVYGGGGDDYLMGAVFGDTSHQLLFGGAGADTIEGGAGDTLDGGDGVDELFLNLLDAATGVTVDFGGLATGTVSILSGAETTQVSSFDHAVIFLTQHDDVARSGDTHVAMEGWDGNDNLRLDVGGYLEGGSGDDRLTGSGEADILQDFDHVSADLIRGEAGDDRIDDAGGDDTLIGGDGNDTISHFYGGDAIIRGGSGNDVIDSQGVDTVDGGSGDDFIGGRAGRFDGGGGFDRIDLTLNDTTDQFAYLNTLGQPGGIGNVGASTTLQNMEAGEIAFGSGDDRIILIDTNFLVIDGGYGDDSILGGAGGDTFFGGAGDDTIQGGSGADLLDGGGGIDTLSFTRSAGGVRVSLHDEAVQDTGGSGLDLVTRFENVLGSVHDDTLTGSQKDNVLLGGNGRDVLVGGLGADTLTGGRDSDTFIFARTADSAPGRGDLIADLQSFDVIDLHRIDADTTTGGDQAFVLAAAFTHQAGQAVLSYDGTVGETALSLDVDGDGVADSVIRIDGDATGFSGLVL